jgi:hypothetical protein
MELIDLSEYDLSYEKQFMTLMVRLLRPYIIFKKPLAPDPSTNLGEPIHGTLNIYWVGDPLLPQPHTWPTNPRFTSILFGTSRPAAKDRNHESLEIISFEEYVHFIQCIFPKIIQDEITKNKEELVLLEIKKEVLLNERHSEPRFILPRFMNGEGDRRRGNEMIKELNRYSRTEINEICKQTDNKPPELSNKIEYLEMIQKINRKENGSINKIIYFLRNLDYLEIQTTQERPWTRIPAPPKFDSFG